MIESTRWFILFGLPSPNLNSDGVYRCSGGALQVALSALNPYEFEYCRTNGKRWANARARIEGFAGQICPFVRHSLLMGLILGNVVSEAYVINSSWTQFALATFEKNSTNQHHCIIWVWLKSNLSLGGMTSSFSLGIEYTNTFRFEYSIFKNSSSLPKIDRNC